MYPVESRCTSRFANRRICFTFDLFVTRFGRGYPILAKIKKTVLLGAQVIKTQSKDLFRDSVNFKLKGKGKEEGERGSDCTVLYCTVLYCTVLYCTVLYCSGVEWSGEEWRGEERTRQRVTVAWWVYWRSRVCVLPMFCSALLCSAVLCCALLRNPMLQC